LLYPSKTLLSVLNLIVPLLGLMGLELVFPGAKILMLFAEVPAYSAIIDPML
jgi:hypothetical protein